MHESKSHISVPDTQKHINVIFTFKQTITINNGYLLGKPNSFHYCSFSLRVNQLKSWLKVWLKQKHLFIDNQQTS